MTDLHPIQNSVGLDVASRLSTCIDNIAFERNISYASGLSGLLLLFCFANQQGLSGKRWDDVIHECILRIKHVIETYGISDLSLFGGLSGVCLAVDSVAEYEKKYCLIASKLRAYLVEKIHDFYIHPLLENVKSHQPSSSRLYDVITGLSGVGRYLLWSKEASGKCEEVRSALTQALIAFCQSIEVEHKVVPGWYMPATDPINASYLKSNEKGNFNLGLAHGITGVLAYLSIASLNGVVEHNQIETIEMISRWIRDKGSNRWPTSISWEEETENIKVSRKPSRDAWCYGVPGIARTLFLAGLALNDRDLKNHAIDSFSQIFLRSRNEWAIPGPSLCHGIAGLLMITREMSKENSNLIPHVKDLEATLLGYFIEASSYGFQDLETHHGGNPIPVDRPGMLEGAAGVAMTLLTSTHKWHNWQIPFLVNE